MIADSAECQCCLRPKSPEPERTGFVVLDSLNLSTFRPFDPDSTGPGPVASSVAGYAHTPDRHQQHHSVDRTEPECT